MNLIGLADCNSFYASCEKAFRPDLREKPVVVLSNNDGCIVALSKEAKALGLTRGVPYFKVKSELAQKHVNVFSSNYTLYQDLSDRIMDFLRSRTEAVEIYSIDEAFFKLEIDSFQQASQSASELNRSIAKCIGLPVSIGLARTKTLAKIANHYAKKRTLSFVLKPSDEADILKETPIDEVWGIGYRSLPKLFAYGIKTAWDLAQTDDQWIRKNFSICGLETVLELRGLPCIGPENSDRKSFTSSISFSKPIKDIKEILTAVACHCSSVCNKLYENKLRASDIAVQLITDRFRSSNPGDMGTGHLDSPSCYTPTLLGLARTITEAIFNGSKEYKSVRVSAWNLTSFSDRQLSLFGKNDETDKEDAVTEAVKRIGKKISCATTQGVDKRSLASFKFLSPCYTTRWEELPFVGRSDVRSVQK